VASPAAGLVRATLGIQCNPPDVSGFLDAFGCPPEILNGLASLAFDIAYPLNVLVDPKANHTLNDVYKTRTAIRVKLDDSVINLLGGSVMRPGGMGENEAGLLRAVLSSVGSAISIRLGDLQEVADFWLSNPDMARTLQPSNLEAFNSMNKPLGQLPRRPQEVQTIVNHIAQCREASAELSVLAGEYASVPCVTVWVSGGVGIRGEFVGGVDVAGLSAFSNSYGAMLKSQLTILDPGTAAMIDK